MVSIAGQVAAAGVTIAHPDAHPDFREQFGAGVPAQGVVL